MKELLAIIVVFGMLVWTLSKEDESKPIQEPEKIQVEKKLEPPKRTVNYQIDESDFHILLNSLRVDYGVSEKAINEIEDSIIEMDEGEFCSEYSEDEMDSYNDDSGMYRGSRY